MIQSSPSIPGLIPLVKFGFVAFAALYFIFSLVIIRQISLMAETVVTELSGVLKIISIAFAVLSLLLLVYFLKTL